MANDLWCTPEWVYKPYEPFNLDAAANIQNRICEAYISEADNALECDWRRFAPSGSKVWCNPPYSQKAGPLMRWVETFKKWSDYYTIVALLPADTSTKWFHKIWSNELQTFKDCKEGKFLTKRVRHIDPTTKLPGGSPKFGSIILIF